MNGTKKYAIMKFKGGAVERVEDLVAVERLIRISINGAALLNVYATPLMVRELVVGLIMTEGIAEGICTERMSIMYGPDEVAVEVHAEGKVSTEGAAVTSGCVGGITFQRKHTDAARADSMTIGAATLQELFRRFQHRSEMYDSTGCIHSAALSDGVDVMAFAEDIGRHNAVDKVIGYNILEGRDFHGTIMLASGRLSSEIVSKCSRWGIPMVVSRTAPTARALDIAIESGITVVGFMRGDRFNVYTHPERISTGL